MILLVRRGAVMLCRYVANVSNPKVQELISLFNMKYSTYKAHGIDGLGQILF